MSLYKSVRFIFRPFFMLAFAVKVKGLENVPDDCGFVVCANHTSMLDVAMIGAAFKQKLNFMAKKELFNFPPLGAFFRGVGAFPVNRGGADVRALKTAMERVNNKEAICMFPQGTRRKHVDPTTTPVRGGVGMVAYHTGCKVVPVFIKTKGNHVRIFKKTEVIIGAPIENEEFGFVNGGSKEYARASRIVFSKILALGGYDYPVDPEKTAKKDEN